MKRDDYITWDEYFMGVALLAARRSKDPNTQVGACIVNKSKRILSTGDRKSTRLNSSHPTTSRMPSSA